MSKRILKWELRAPGVTVIDTPAWTDLLRVGFQEERLCVWVAAERGRPQRRWTFHVIETGEYVPAGTEHIGTALGTWRGSPYAAHVYAKREELP